MSKLYPYGEVEKGQGRLFSVKSFTEKGTVYTVRVNTSGLWFCSCPRAVFGNKDSVCKHLLAVKDFLKKQKEVKNAGRTNDRSGSRFPDKHTGFRGNSKDD